MKTIEHLIAEEKTVIAKEHATRVQGILDQLKRLYGDELYYALNIDTEFSFTYKGNRFYLKMNPYGIWFIGVHMVSSRRSLLQFLEQV